ncbi:SH3 domain-containing protein [Leptospira koniambonensis]|uniref:SH3 domain-containing protein n=1 Tax=Leptospira koniambonensis TaxID=2484950 RepID=UPI003EBBF7F4
MKIRSLFFSICLTCLFAQDILGLETKDSCFTIYPNVLVRSSPSQKGRIVRKIEQSTFIEIEEHNTSEISKIEIRNNSIEGNWVKVSDGWIFSGLIKCIPRIAFTFSSSSVYHRDELPFKPDDLADWIAIYNRKGIYSRELIEIEVKREHDSVLDEKKSVKTGYRVSAKDDPVVLVKGISFKKGSYTINKKNLPSSIGLGEKYEFTFGNNKYVLKSSGEQIDSERVRNYKLTLKKNNNEMIIDSAEERYEVPSLVFAGDIDGDGELDFIFDLTGHYNLSDLYLYISSEKENDFFVVPVSNHLTRGC